MAAALPPSSYADDQNSSSVSWEGRQTHSDSTLQSWLDRDYGYCLEFTSRHLPDNPKRIGHCFCRYDKSYDLLDQLETGPRLFVMDIAEKHSRSCLNKEGAGGACGTSVLPLLEDGAHDHGMSPRNARATWIRYELGISACSSASEIDRYYARRILTTGIEDIEVDEAQFGDATWQDCSGKEKLCEVAGFIRMQYPNIPKSASELFRICPAVVDYYDSVKSNIRHYDRLQQVAAIVAETYLSPTKGVRASIADGKTKSALGEMLFNAGTAIIKFDLRENQELKLPVLTGVLAESRFSSHLKLCRR